MAETFVTLLDGGAPLSELSHCADELSPADRVKLLTDFRGRRFASLFAQAQSREPVADLSFLVPETVGASTVEFVGRNSLPVFSAFTKRFVRGPEKDTLIGHNTGAMQWAVGPGYFTALRRPERPSELLFDYTRYPAAAPAGWPPVKKNTRGISFFVFANMHDYVRPVGSHMAIGAAYTRHGKFKGQYFILARGQALALGKDEPSRSTARTDVDRQRQTGT